MKKLVFSFAFLLIAQITMAQDASYKANTLKLITISGADSQIKAVKPNILKMIPESKREDFSKAFDASIPSLLDKMATVYMDIFTADEIKEMIAYYETPIGKKMSEKSGELTQKSMLAGQQWAQELQGLIAKYKEDPPAQGGTYSLTKPNK